MKVATDYDPFDREQDESIERERAARAEHEAWSLDQAKRGNSAAQRDNAPVWVKRLPEEIR